MAVSILFYLLCVACIVFVRHHHQQDVSLLPRSGSMLAAVVKIDLFFIVSYTAQLTPSGLLGYDTSGLEVTLVVVLACLFFLSGWYALSKPLLLSILLACGALSVGYFGYRLVTFAMPRTAGQDPYQVSFCFSAIEAHRVSQHCLIGDAVQSSFYHSMRRPLGHGHGRCWC